MIKKLLLGVLALLALLILGPPLWYAVFPGEPPPQLPAAHTRVELSSGVGINVVEAGAGRPALLVHGLPGSAYDWRVLEGELVSRGYRTLAIDRSGYGHSDPNPDGDYSVRRNADDILELMEVMDLQDVVLVGWSYGGATSSVVAARRPERLGQLVLIGTGGPDGADAKPPEANAVMTALYSEPVMRWRSAIPPLAVGLITVLSEQAYSDKPMPDWWIPGTVANFGKWHTLLTYRGEMFGLDVDDGFDYGDIEVPTLLLHGDDDRLAPIGISRYLVTQIPGAELIETPGGSHMLPVLQAPALADAIERFAPPVVEPILEHYDLDLDPAESPGAESATTAD
jgi:pimeloyl-ACP methyl ester carboxylesterase